MQKRTKAIGWKTEKTGRILSDDEDGIEVDEEVLAETLMRGDLERLISGAMLGRF